MTAAATFRTATAVTPIALAAGIAAASDVAAGGPVDGLAGGPGVEPGVDRRRFGATIHDGWDIGGNANGGYLMAIAGRAMADAIGRPPVSLTAHFLRPGPAGPCTIDVTPVRVGRRLATARASMLIAGKPTLELLGTFGDQQPDPGRPRWAREQPVMIPAYDECEPMPASTAGTGPALMDRLACRLRPGDDGFRNGRPSGDPEIRGWFALADGESIDAIALLLAADAFPPPVFNSDLPVAWVPTVELTVHLRGVPAAGPLRCAFRSRFIHDGLLDEEGEIWDSTGTLVAQSRQLSLTPR
jgi:acyl-coenzyme A thioesterase PaaI-like protein